MTAAPMVRMESLSWLRLCDSQPQEFLFGPDVNQGARHLVLEVFINLPPGLLLPETFSTVTVFHVFFHSFFYSSSSSSSTFLSFSTGQYHSFTMADGCESGYFFPHLYFPLPIVLVSISKLVPSLTITQ
jgi:hypothetical protein